MSLSRPRRHPPQGFHIPNGVTSSSNRNNNVRNLYDSSFHPNEISRKIRDHQYRLDVDSGPSFKRRKFASSNWEGSGRQYLHSQVQQLTMVTYAPAMTSHSNYPGFTRSDTDFSGSFSHKAEQPKSEDDTVFMSREEIDRCSPSRKDGIDSLRETHLRYSYCAFLQNLGLRLELPQTTIGTAMVLCHRFFVRRSHACHDRFLIATAALFLTAKSEETSRPLNTVLRLSYEICHKQDLSFFPYLLPSDWFEQYRERILEAEHIILRTLDFELNVQHPYNPLTSVLNKLGFSQSALVNLAWNLVSEGVFKNSVLTCVVFLLGGLIHYSCRMLFTFEVETLGCYG
ncbi:cyclin-T1-4-like isoform X2 [Aristolochia californica]|uniref:cyclin-T1-4-like isoform X2 n=1 Tax=Aristolochia californica TaxID=171875 RepID=UPI0035E0B6F6